MAISVSVMLLPSGLANAELIPPNNDGEITVVIPLAHATAPSYHWWDVLTSGASGFFAPKIDDANSAIDHAHDEAKAAGGYITSNAAQAKDDAKEKAEYVGTKVQERAYRFGHKAQHEAANAQKQAKESAQNIGRNVKHKGQDAYRKLDKEGRGLAHEAQHKADSNLYYCDGYLSCLFSRFKSHIHQMVAATRGASGHLRADLKYGLEKLGNVLGSLNEGASPSWPEAVFDGSRDPAFSKYIHELGQASQSANDQIKTKLNIHSAMLASIARSHLSSYLTLSGCYIPVLALISLYAIAKSVCRNSELNRDTSSRSQGRGGSGSKESESEHKVAASNAFAMSNTFLGVVPMAVILLVVMEFNGMAGWLIASSYTVLIAGTVAAAQPSLLNGVLSSTDGVASIGLRLAIGITTIAAASCLIHAFFG
ncbi:hypothetical protein GGI25_003199 [Coemansia spiralis]|uniref:Uncharacterized protein n=2 Tax=Coemansia TaxID=4863 RepID=A0A9W8G926_9FUNG|nr:hypothetical protein EDC05_003194 [Coemansia umbellata]KAJ2621889.1 hypothetical protein GGI26_003732 [Coemansia sp. RSA 1358]KAJ2677444.1 hypothetical protein GGI25_003199 [Coemansia spiralis]